MLAQTETPPAATEGAEEEPSTRPDYTEARDVLPDELLCVRRWLLWKSVQKPGEAKPRKVPYYAGGQMRAVGITLDSPEDVAQLVTFDDVVSAYQRNPGGWSGIGFAAVGGDNIGAGDLDDCLDDAGNIISDEARQLYESASAAGCYVEKSPSGKGLRFFGHTDGFVVIKSPKLEAYCSVRYLTVTGVCIANPKGFGSIDPTVALMRQLAGGVQHHSKPAGSRRAGINDDLITGYVTPEVVPQGGRNAAVLAFVGHLRGTGVPEATVRRATHDFNKARCDPALDDAEVDGLVDRYEEQQAASPDWLAKLNDAYAWISADAAIYRIPYGDFIKTEAFRTAHDNQTVSYVSYKVKDGSKEVTKTVGSGGAWLRHPGRRQHNRLVLRPAEGLVTHDNCLNEYRGAAVAPGIGDAMPFFQLAMRLVGKRKACEFVFHWIAHLIQHPAVKMHTSLIFWSHEEGPGKNLLFECLVRIIGPTHATVIGQAELDSSFNGWAKSKVFVVGDEVSGSDRRPVADKLKGLITGTTIYVNEKHQPAREVPNLMNFVFLSNHHDALFLNDHDRRYFVWEVTSGRLPTDIAEAFVHWRDNGGLAALHHFLLNHDITGFDPKAPAPMTDAKMQMVQDNRSDMEAWTAELMASDVAELIGREVATAIELGGRYANETGHQKPSAKTMVGACKRNGAYARDSQVRLKSGKKARVLALTRPDYWKAQPEPAWSEEMEKPLKFR